MAVTFTPDCFNTDDAVDPNWEELSDEEYDARYPAEASGHTSDGWEAEPRFRVATDTVERAADALVVAAERFMLVGDSGTEYPDDPDAPWDQAPAWEEAEDRIPSSVLVSVDDEAAYVSADTDDWLSHKMVDTMKSILVQELTKAGVSAEVSADHNPIRGIKAQPWPRTAR